MLPRVLPRIALAVRSSVAPLLGVRDARTRALCRACEVVPSACGRGVPCGLDGGVVLEFALGLARHLAKGCYVAVAQGRVGSGSGTWIDSATTSGSEG
jgi:hypothetical protein